MKFMITRLLILGLTACGQSSNMNSSLQSSSGVTRPAQSIVLNGKDAEVLIAALVKAGIPTLSAIESTSWSVKKVECYRFFKERLGLQSTCQLDLPKSGTAQGPVTRPSASINIDKTEAKSFISILEDVVGILPKSAIESTNWTTGSVNCSRFFVAGNGLQSECSVRL